MNIQLYHELLERERMNEAKPSMTEGRTDERTIQFHETGTPNHETGRQFLTKPS